MESSVPQLRLTICAPGNIAQPRRRIKTGSAYAPHRQNEALVSQETASG